MNPSTRNRPDNHSPRTATTHNTRSERHHSEWTNSRSRSRRPHRGITIRRCGPASGRPRDRTRAAEIDEIHRTIMSRWAGC